VRLRSGLEWLCPRERRLRASVAGGRVGCGLRFIGAYDSPRIATIIHLELLFRRWFEAQGDTPVGVGRGCKNRSTVLLYCNPAGLVGLRELKHD